MRLLSPQWGAHRAAVGIPASASFAREIAQNPERYARSAWPLFVEVALRSKMNSAIYNALVAAAPEHVEWFLQDLTSAPRSGLLDYHCRSRVLLRALGRDARSLAQPLARALERELSEPLSQAERIVDVLGFIGDRSVVPALISALRHPDWVISLAACRALSRLGLEAKQSEHELTRVAEDHWLLAVRQSAVLTKRFVLSRCRTDSLPPRHDTPLHSVYEALARADVVEGAFLLVNLPDSTLRGVSLSPRARKCPWNGRWYPMVSENPVIPKRFEGVRWRSPRGDVEFVARGKLSWLRASGGDLVAINGGEFGSVILHIDASRRLHSLHAGSARWLAPTPYGIVAIGGLSHMMRTSGAVYRLTPSRGTWTAKGFARLPGAPSSFAVAADGTLLISTVRGNVAVDPSGRIIQIRCECDGNSQC